MATQWHILYCTERTTRWERASGGFAALALLIVMHHIPIGVNTLRAHHIALCTIWISAEPTEVQPNIRVYKGRIIAFFCHKRAAEMDNYKTGSVTPFAHLNCNGNSKTKSAGCTHIKYHIHIIRERERWERRVLPAVVCLSVSPPLRVWDDFL